MIFLRTAKLVSRRALWLWRLGLAADPSARLDGDALDALRRCIDGFLRAGGRIGPEEFARLTAVERVMLAHVGDALRAEIAAATGIASQGRMEAASVLAPSDGGHAKAQMILESLATAKARELNQSPPENDGRFGVYGEDDGRENEDGS